MSLKAHELREALAAQKLREYSYAGKPLHLWSALEEPEKIFWIERVKAIQGIVDATYDVLGDWTLEASFNRMLEDYRSQWKPGTAKWREAISYFCSLLQPEFTSTQRADYNSKLEASDSVTLFELEELGA